MAPLHKYNTFGKRFVAGLIDGMVFLPFSLLINHCEHTADKTTFLVSILCSIICWTLYVVMGHGRYGQTIGKRLMDIKVFDIQEQNIIGYKRAFYREAVWFFAAIFGLVYFIVTTHNSAVADKHLNDIYLEGYVRLTISIWFVLELVTMFFNKKGRALHDYIAGAIIVDLNELKREDLQHRHQQLIDSIQSR